MSLEELVELSDVELLKQIISDQRESIKVLQEAILALTRNSFPISLQPPVNTPAPGTTPWCPNPYPWGTTTTYEGSTSTLGGANGIGDFQSSFSVSDTQSQDVSGGKGQVYAGSKSRFD